MVRDEKCVQDEVLDESKKEKDVVRLSDGVRREMVK